MTVKSMNQLLAQADATIEDNTTGAISAGDVRNLIKDFIDSVSPAYGGMQLDSQVLALSATAVVIAPYARTIAALAGFFSTNLTAGTVTRLIGASGLAGGSTNITISGSVSGVNNANVLVRLYKNGAPTSFVASVTCSGVGDNQGFNISAIDYTDGAGPTDAVFDLRATGPAGSFTFTDVTIICSALPVRSYV